MSYEENMARFRGAPMGRPSSGVAPTGPVELTEVEIDEGGYDDMGSYWGTGLPLWYACDATCQYEDWFRASDLDAAKSKLQEWFPGVSFLGDTEVEPVAQPIVKARPQSPGM